MKHLFTTIVLLFTIVFTITATDRSIFSKRTGLQMIFFSIIHILNNITLAGSINVLLRSKRASAFDALTNDLIPTGDSNGLQQWTKKGGLNQAFDDFMSLPGKSSKDISQDGKIIFTKDLGDGVHKVTMRDYSSGGTPSLDLLKNSGGSKIGAIRYED